MAVNWNVRAVYPDGGIMDVNFFGKESADRTADSARERGAQVTVTPLNTPPVPSPVDTEREAFLAEQQEYYWLDRPDDYNVFEENCLAQDNEGGC